MLAKYEKRDYSGGELIWIGKYRNLHNILHWHVEHEIIACQTGSARVMVDNKLYIVNENQCVFCPGGAVHNIDADSNSILMVCLFDGSLTKSITKNYRLASPVYEDKYDTYDMLAAIRSELGSKSPFYTEKANSMLTSLLIRIFREESLTENMPEDSPTVARFKELLNWIDENFEFVSFSDAAAYMNLSEPYFSRYFKRMSGMTFSKYLNNMKIEKAVSILSDNRSILITDLMLQCGFNTIRNFNRTFKEITGCSPTKLPSGYTLIVKSFPTRKDNFNPTLNTSILL